MINDNGQYIGLNMNMVFPFERQLQEHSMNNLVVEQILNVFGK